MTASSDRDDLSVPEFGGKVRLFPLPNLVMFPHVVQPLHVFEPRYVQMLNAALSDDQLVAMALLQPGWELHYEGRPPIHPVVCVGRVIAHRAIEGGRYNLLLRGLRRAAIVREKPPQDPFRVAQIAILEDLYSTGGSAAREQLRSELLERFREACPSSVAGLEPLDCQDLSLGAIVDILAHSLDLGLACKQRLLAEWNVDQRAAMLLKLLEPLAHGDPPPGPNGFPPLFSSN